MDVLIQFKKIATYLLLALLLSGCQITYYLKSAYSQAKLLSSQESITKTLENEKLSEEKKNKIKLAVEAKEFAEKHVHLKKTENYSSYVELGRPYVSWVVSAAPQWELKHHYFDYLVVGKLPYKGFFTELEAQKEEEMLKTEGLDTFLRGVSAYSTLGWFDDPLLSSMLNYRDFDLVNTVIHETVHATVFFKGSANFNERLATFVGNQATLEFYQKKEGIKSPTVDLIKKDVHDEMLFSKFISKEINELKKWYSDQSNRSLEQRTKRFSQIVENFNNDILLQLKSERFKSFGSKPLNNARLLVYSTYNEDLADFESLYKYSDYDWKKFFDIVRSFEKSKNPEVDLKKVISTFPQ